MPVTAVNPTPLPPPPAYEGGPRILNADTPEGSDAEGWWFSAGDERVSMAYGFMIGPGGEFGIHAERNGASAAADRSLTGNDHPHGCTVAAPWVPVAGRVQVSLGHPAAACTTPPRGLG